MKKLIPALLLSTSLTMSAIAFAEADAEPYQQHDPQHYLLHERVADKLALSDAQREQIQSLISSHREQYPRERGTYREQRKSINELLDAPTFDEAQVRNILTEQSERHLVALRLQHELRQVLDSDQREKLDTMQKRMTKRDHQGGKWQHEGLDGKPSKNHQ
ncbi:MAG TPA: periplasmic heavy metal sensor [Cellvibrionaceae bacterium]